MHEQRRRILKTRKKIFQANINKKKAGVAMDIRQNGVLGKPAPSGTQPWAFTVHTVSLFLFLAFIKRVRAKPLGKGNCLWVLAMYSLKSQGIAKL